MISSSWLRPLLTILTLYFGLFFLLLFFLDSIIFLPQIPGRTLEADPSALGIPFEEINFPAADGTRLHGWFIPGTRSVALLHFHGNAGNISHRLGYVQQMHRLGVPLLIFDYRGYGRSEGRPNEQGVYADALAAWQALLAKGFSPESIVLAGHSLGGAIAAELSTRVDSPLLVIESSFASLRSIGGRLFPYRLWAPFIPNYYDTMGRLPASRARRIWLAHDPEDEMIPHAEAELLLQAAGERGVLHSLREGGHNHFHEGAEWLRRFDEALRDVESGKQATGDREEP